MLSELETGLGLEIVRWVQAHTGPPGLLLAQALHFMGGGVSYLVILALFIGISGQGRLRRALRLRDAADRRRLFTQMLYYALLTLALTLLMIDLLKTAFDRPRPYVVAPDVVAVWVVNIDARGIPSGHVAMALAMTAVMVMVLAPGRPRWWMWAGALGYGLLMGWARMAVGVHYPQDVVAGLLVGVAGVGLAVWMGRRLWPRWSAWPGWAQALSGVLLAGAVVLL
jgi:membrane-associated phospholipid phosphatase